MKNCIICGNKAGSREHIFPASLGGRRVNRKIYCEKHNNGFSPLAKILSDQLVAINSLLSVRPDHSDVPCTFEVGTPDGDTYILSGGRIELAPPPPLKENKSGVPLELMTAFSSQKQAEQWLAEQRKRGYSVKLERGKVESKYFSEPLHIRITLGGHEFLRAIGYIVLTFFAHYFPDLARQTGASKLKDFVQSASEEELVWWEAPSSLNGISPSPYRFGHTVVIAVSAANKEAYARISLFSTFDFAVHIGAVESVSDQIVTIHINPQAEHPPGDIHETRGDVLPFIVNRPLSLTTELKQIIKDGRAQESAQVLLEKISHWHLECTAQQVLGELNEINEINYTKRIAKIKTIIDSHGQRVLNLMLYVINGMKQEFASDPKTTAIVSLLDTLFAPDIITSTGLNQFTAAFLEVAKVKLVEEIEKDFSNGELNLDRLSMLLGGGAGAALIGETILDIIFKQL
jgi:hypothetical protein